MQSVWLLAEGPEGELLLEQPHSQLIHRYLLLPLCRAYSPQAYVQLRDCTIAEAASALAAAQRWEELAMLLARHPYVLLPSVLDALAAAPETADPAKLVPLLQQLAAQQEPPLLAREADWVESEATVQELRAADQFGLLLATEPLAALSMGWRPPSSRRLAAWVCERALALDAATGQLPGAMALLEVGRAAVHYSEQSLNELLEAAHELSTVLRLATMHSSGGGEAGGTGESAAGAAAGPEGALRQMPAWQLRLREYAALEPLARLRALLALLGTDGLAADLPSVVAPFLSRMDGVDTGLLLRQVLEREAAARLSWAVRFVQAEAEQRCLFDSSVELAKAAAAVVYGTAATDAWGLLEAVLGAAGEAIASDEELEHEAAEAARDMLLTVCDCPVGAALVPSSPHLSTASLHPHARTKGGLTPAPPTQVRGHVTAARLLTKHGLATSVRMVRDADAHAAERLLCSLLARVARAKDSESRWVEVWMDLRTVHDRGLSQLPEPVLRREFCSVLLRCGRHRLAASYLQGLETAQAEALVLAAAREAFLSATGLGDAAVRQAARCLEALPGSAAAQRELGRMEAAMKLAALGVELAPVQLHTAAAQGPDGSRKLLEQARASGSNGPADAALRCRTVRRCARCCQSDAMRTHPICRSWLRSRSWRTMPTPRCS